MSRYKDFIEDLKKAAFSAGRDIDEIEVIAVSKKKSKQEIQDVIDENHISFGENQIQEIINKWPDLKNQNSKIKINFVGAIQSKKVSDIFNYCDVIHSIDRMKVVKLFSELEKINEDKKQYFIQVNTGNETQKSGVMFDEADKFINECLSNFRLNIIGLMCLPPMREDPRLHFNRLKKLAADHNLHSLSMGMSGDYHAAIECGATHIRIGTNIFGTRD